MSLSEFYLSTIVEVKAYFGFNDFECDPNEISAATGIQPDEVFRKGERRITQSGRATTVHANDWSVASRSRSKDVNDHLRELLARLGKPPLRPEWGIPSFSVLWKGNYLYAGSGPVYEADVIAGIAALGAELWHDIYQVDQEDDEIDNPSPFRRLPHD